MRYKLLIASFLFVSLSLAAQDKGDGFGPRFGSLGCRVDSFSLRRSGLGRRGDGFPIP